MLSHVTAIRFDGRVQSGRTKPSRLTCEAADGTEVEVVAKLSDGCDRKVTALAMEAIAAMLAADLDLPVPEPFLVTLEPEFIAEIPDELVAAMARRSNPLGIRLEAFAARLYELAGRQGDPQGCARHGRRDIRLRCPDRERRPAPGEPELSFQRVQPRDLRP